METMPRASSTQGFNDLSALPAVRDRDHVTGSSSPRLTLVEYGACGCPYCFAVSRPVKALLDRFDGLRLVRRHFPAPHLHPLSMTGRLELGPAETQAALSERRFRARVLADIEGGRRAGVHATPTFFVDGERLHRPWRDLAQIVPARLAYSEGGAS